MLDGLRYRDGLLLIDPVVQALRSGDLKLPGHRDQAIPIEIEPFRVQTVLAHPAHGQEMGGIALLPDENVPGPGRNRHYFDVGPVPDGEGRKGLRVDVPHRLALIARTATDTATIVLHLRVDDPIATNFLNKRQIGLGSGRILKWIRDPGFRTTSLPCRCRRCTCCWCRGCRECRPVRWRPNWQ